MEKTISQLTVEAWQAVQDDTIDSIVLERFYEKHPEIKKEYQSKPQSRPAILLLAYRDEWVNVVTSLEKAERIICSMN